MLEELTTQAVEHAPIHRGLLNAVNPVITAILRSRLHRALAGFRPPLMLLTVSGRKTGRRYTIVVGVHDVDGTSTIFTSMPWRVNLRGGADVEILSNGASSTVHAVLVEDPGQVADAYAAVIGRLGWKAAQRQLALKIHVRRTPTHAELVQVVEGAHLSVIRLCPESRPRM
jgi:hypothetical protein